MGKVNAAKDAVPVDVVALSPPEVLLCLAHLGRRVEDAAARQLLADDEHPLVQGVRLGVLREEVSPERCAYEWRQVARQLVARLQITACGTCLERPFRHLGIRAPGYVDAAR